MRATRFIQLCCAIILLVSCARSRSGLYPADAPNLAFQLGITQREWLEVQTLIRREKDEGGDAYELVYLERNALGYVGAWMAHKSPPETRPHGPVFFYTKADRRWYRLDDMSEWGNE